MFNDKELASSVEGKTPVNFKRWEQKVKRRVVVDATLRAGGFHFYEWVLGIPATD